MVSDCDLEPWGGPRNSRTCLGKCCPESPSISYVKCKPGSQPCHPVDREEAGAPFGAGHFVPEWGMEFGNELFEHLEII